jgi:hypothetical protein
MPAQQIFEEKKLNDNKRKNSILRSGDLAEFNLSTHT